MSTDTNETIALSGPNNGRWYFTQIPDWIALNPNLKDGAFRLYVILRSLIVEKDDDHVRLLTHDEIAYMMVGKNGKPSTVSTVKALLRNLEEVGLIEHPDGSRMASPTGRGNPHASLRYRLADWPDLKEYTGWRNSFDKLDWYSEGWEETRPDVASDDYSAWLAGEQKASPPRRDREQGEEKASPQANKNTRHRRSFSSQKKPVTSNNTTPNKSLQQVSPTSSSSSTHVEDPEPGPTPPPKKTKRTSTRNQGREEAKALIAQRLPDTTDDEHEAIIDLVYAEATARGRKIGFITTYINGRPDGLLQQDLQQVRGHAPKNVHHLPSSSVVGGAHVPLPTAQEQERMTHMTQDELREALLGQ